ncbi:hypothetical protein [Actinosynnema sp. NPDC020468]|uniref:hypothetical protein n=1 Tax=Actinosynnema sp. NPDC020468 TaxID=3154488 RepID=UPI0033D0B35F
MGVASEVVPHRAAGVELVGELKGSGYRRPPALVRRADGQVVQLTPLLYRVLAAVDGRSDHADIARAVGPAVGRRVTAEDVRALLDGKLAPLGVLRLADGSEPEVRKSQPLLGLRFRRVVSDPAVTRRITAPFARLFHPLVVGVVLAAFAAVTAWVLFVKGLAGAAHDAFARPGLLLLVFAVSVLSAGFHEFGHAAAARYGGATPGAMGFGLYLFWPAFYTDVTDSYRLGRGGRLRTDLGGLYFNAVVVVAAFGAWWLSAWDALLLVVVAQVFQMLRQLAPFVRFDGYHVLADLVGVPDLFHRIKPTLLGLLPWRWRAPESRVLKPWARFVVTAWVLVVVPVLVLGTALVVLTLPRVVATAWQAVGRQWHGAAVAWDAGDLASVLVRVLGVAAVLLPLLGTGLVLARLVKRVFGRLRPVWRVLVGVVAIAALLWAWWPDSDRYRPIGPDERGTVQDVARHGVAPQGSPRPASAGTATAVGTASPTWTTRSAPTRDRPVPALVLRPVDGKSPTWVFPVDRPRPPGAADNQALAVNTTDGSVRYEVAFALVWATDGVVDSRNEAYALASCQGCTTVAVAFQVVFVVGQADVVVPENLAVAINQSCVDCVTFALATQLVVALPNGLSPQARAELDEVWARLPDLARDLRGKSAVEIRDALTLVERDVLDVVRRDTTTTTAPTTTSTPVPVPTTTPVPTPVPTPEPTSVPTPTSETPSASVEPSGTTAPVEPTTPTG